MPSKFWSVLAPPIAISHPFANDVVDFSAELLDAQPFADEEALRDYAMKLRALAARYDDVVYRFDTTNGQVQQVKVGAEPHGLTVWPIPGRYSLGHTGNMR